MIKQKGFTLIEVMVAMVISIGISLASISLMLNESNMMLQNTKKSQAEQEGLAAFNLISDLLSQSVLCLTTCPTVTKIDITYPNGISNPNGLNVLSINGDFIDIKFTIPNGYSAWPNDIAPYTSNEIIVKWDKTTETVKISAGLGNSTRTDYIIAGGSGAKDYKVINFDLWPLVTSNGVIVNGSTVNSRPTAGYKLSMTVRVSSPDNTYLNLTDPTGAYKNYRTVTFNKIVMPRNW